MNSLNQLGGEITPQNHKINKKQNYRLKFMENRVYWLQIQLNMIHSQNKKLKKF